MWRTVISAHNTFTLFPYLTSMANVWKNRVCLRLLCTSQYSEMLNISYKNPCVDLQQYLCVPIFKEGDNCFEPSVKSMECARKLFIPKDNNIQCISSTVDSQKYPTHALPEIAFLGRTNAGKSSLLKAIFNEVPELRIRTSKTPGATKCLKFYTVGNNLCLVDMPGYGIKLPKWCESSVISYLKNRKNLMKTFFLIDAKEGFHTWDDAALQMLEDLKIPFAIVLTKIDEVSDSYRLRHFLHLQHIRDNVKQNTCFPQVFMLSSHSSEGLMYFLSFIAHITGNLTSETS